MWCDAVMQVWSYSKRVSADGKAGAACAQAAEACIATLTGHDRGVTFVAFHPKEKNVLASKS